MDIQSGLNAGIPKLFHVKTGHGEKDREAIVNNYFLSRKINSIKNNSNLILINNLEEFMIS